MPSYVKDNNGGHMVLGRGQKGYLVTLMLPSDVGGSRALLMLEVWASGMIEAIAMVEEVSVGEVVSCLKLWTI